MDVNGTRFHLLVGKHDWMGTQDRAPIMSSSGSPPRQELCWDKTHAALSLRPLGFRFPTPPGDRLPHSEDRRGAGRDRYENWYWIAENGTEIRFLQAGRRQSEHLWSVEDWIIACEPEDEAGAFQPVTVPPPLAPLHLSGLAVTERHYLVVGVLHPAGLLIFDLHAGGPPISMRWPSQVPFMPFDMAPAPGGGVWILDRKARRYWALDHYFRVITADQEEVTIAAPAEDDFQPETGPPCQRSERSFPVGISLEMASPVEARYPVALEALSDGTVLILDSDPAVAYSVVYRYRFGHQLGQWVLDQALKDFLDVHTLPDHPDPFALRGHDMAFVPAQDTQPGQVTGALYIVASGGNQTFAFTFQAEKVSSSLEIRKHYFPMRLYSGKALVAAGQGVYYDLQDRWISLVKQPRPRFTPEGTLETIEFDGREPNCVWHRLLLDACIPAGTEVRVESRTANDRNLLTHEPWQAEPRLYPREDGAEIPYYQPFPPDEDTQDGTGTWELLFQRAQGRYLQLRLTLRGTGRSTPRLRALRAYYPRFSYLKEYLPTAYQDDELSGSFLERFLANTEGLYTVLEGKIAQAQVLFDVHTTTTEYLEWLAGWLGVVLDKTWDEPRQRLFLSHAVELFNQRGTLAGLIRAIRLAIDPCPDDTLFTEDVSGETVSGGECRTQSPRIVRRSVRIVERFLTRSIPGVVYGDPTDVVAPGLVASTSDWTPAQGAEPLHQLYQTYLRNRYQTVERLNTSWEKTYKTFDELRFPPVLPTTQAMREDWRRFVRRGMGFTYAVVQSTDEPVYQAFLARRYRQVALLNNAYQLTEEQALSAFTAVKLPGEDDLPSGGPRLYDWIQFVSWVLPLRRNAHRFSVLVPIDLRSDMADQERRLQWVQRIVDLEKPAHTNFEVKPYWAHFRVGEVRLGLDTILDVDSRFVALVLGRGYLAESYLAPSHPWDVRDRTVAGRDHIGSELVL